MSLHYPCKKCGKLTTKRASVCAKCEKEAKEASLKEAKKDFNKKAQYARDLLSAINETSDGHYIADSKRKR